MKKLSILNLILLLLLYKANAQQVVSLSYEARPIKSIIKGVRHAQVLKTDEGYYLTGTTGDSSWQVSNKTINLWFSKDLNIWENLGVIWDNTKDKYWRAAGWGIPGTFHSAPVKAIQAPEIHRIKGEWYLVYSNTFGGIAILKSESNKPTGPYQNWAMLTDYLGFDPSLFHDDGKTYLVFNGGFIAELNDSLNKIVKQPVCIVPGIAMIKGWGMPPVTDRIGTTGAQILKINGKYCLIAGDKHHRMGTYTNDVFIGVSEGDIYGPYHRRYLAIPHANHSTIFTDNNNNFYATYSGNTNDPYALLKGSTGIVPLEFYERNDYDFPCLRPTSDIILAKGIISNMRAVKSMKDVFMRDPSICIGHDSAYYLVATPGAKSLPPDGGINIWRSEDLENWENLGQIWSWNKDATWHKTRKKQKQKEYLWAPEIAYINNQYHVTFSMSSVPRVTAYIRTTDGKPNGNYTDPFKKPIVDGIDGFFYQNDDGSVYYLWAGGRIAKFNNDMTAISEESNIITQLNEKMGYEGCSLIKVHGKYVLTASDWSGDHFGTYNLMYSVADSINGPWSPRKFAFPHAGHATIFFGKENKLYSTVFGSDPTAPLRNRLGIIEIEIDENFNFKAIDTKIGY